MKNHSQPNWVFLEITISLFLESMCFKSKEFPNWVIFHSNREGNVFRNQIVGKYLRKYGRRASRRRIIPFWLLNQWKNPKQLPELSYFDFLLDTFLSKRKICWLPWKCLIFLRFNQPKPGFGTKSQYFLIKCQCYRNQNIFLIQLIVYSFCGT